MSIGIRDFRMAIRMDNAQAKQALVETKEQIKTLREELDKMAVEGKRNTDDYKAKQAVLDKLNAKYQEQQRQAGLTAMSYNDLSKSARTLRQMMNSAIPGSENKKAYRDDLVLTEKRMAQLRRESYQTKSTLEKFSTGYTKIAAIGTAVGFVTSRVVNGVNQIMEERNKLESSSANVKALTGLDDADVMKLQANARKMSSALTEEGVRIQQSAVEINDSFAIVGSQRPELLKNADALKEVTQNAIYLSIAGKEELEPSTKAVTNSMNQFNLGADQSRRIINTLAAGSQAGAAGIGYLSQAVEKAGTTANLMGISFEQTVGALEAVAPKFTDASIAGNSLDKVLGIMQKKQIGYKDGVFDLNRALDELAARQEKGQLMSDLFGSEHRKMAEVLIQNKADVIDYTQAVTGTNKAVEQAVINSDTMEGRLQQAKNMLQNARIELGDKLVPAVILATDSLTSMVRVLPDVLSFFSKWGTTIVQLVILIASYTAGVKLHTMWVTKLRTANLAHMAVEKLRLIQVQASIAAEYALAAAQALLSKNTVALKIAMQGLFNTIKANPWGLLATLIVGAALAIYNFCTRTNEAKDAVKAFMIESEKEKNELRKLTDAAKRAGDGTEKRKELINEINAKYGKYLTNLLDECATLQDIQEAYKEINIAMDQNIAKKIVEEKTEEISRGYMDKKISEMNDIRDLLSEDLPDLQVKSITRQIDELARKALEAGTEVGQISSTLVQKIKTVFYQGGDISNSLKGQIADYVKVLKEESKKVKAVKDDMAAFVPTVEKKNELPEVTVTANAPKNANPDGMTEEERKALAQKHEQERKKLFQKEEKKLKSDYEAEQNEAKKKFLDNDKKTEEEYQSELYKAEIAYLTKRVALLQDFKEDASEVQGQIYDKMIAEADRLDKAQKDAEKKKKDEEKKEKTSSFTTLDNTYQEDQALITQQYLDGQIKTEKEFQKKMKELEADYLNSRKKILEGYGDDVSKVNKQIQDNQLDQKKEEKEEKKDQGFKDIDKTFSESDKLDKLKEMYDADLISYEEYEKKKTEISEECAKTREQIANAAFQVLGQAAGVASDVVQAMQDRETSKVTKAYDQKIKAAKKAGKDTTKLEEEKEEAINAVKKKYADKQFKATVLQVIATTAVSAMEAYKSMAGIPIVGPVLGAIAAAATIAAGAVQIANAKQARDEAKGLKEGGYSKDYVEGYTTSGNPDDVAGVIPVHKDEFVGNHEGVANPHVKQFYDVFDMAQKNGSIRMINTTQILEQVRTRSGKYSGGYTQEDSTGKSSSFDFSSFGGNADDANLKTVIMLLTESNRILNVIADKDLVVDSREVRKGLQKLDKLEANVSRK